MRDNALSLLSFLIYIPLQLIFVPFAIVGALWVAYRQIGISKKLGVSQTAVEILNGRWTMHVFGLRHDEATARLGNVLPNTSLGGLWLVLFPLWLKYKICGELFLYPKVPIKGREGIADFIVARTLYIDEMVDRAASEVQQFVMLGAGYDTRAYRGLPNKSVRIFELDQAVVQQHKLEALAHAGIDSDHVTFVAVDFAVDDIVQRLLDAGYESSKPTLFLWEGVSLYLTEAEVRATIRQIRGAASNRGILVADFYSTRFLAKLGGSAAAKRTLDATDESLKFSLPFSSDYLNLLQAFAGSESLTLQQADFLGANSKDGPFAVVAELRI